MKQFLRYQISGMVFIAWVVICYAAMQETSFLVGMKRLLSDINTAGIERLALGGLITALPVGVLIHQLSVLIKNWFFACLFKEISDFPKKAYFKHLDGVNSKKAEYILEKISSLNSFYYVRFDNGLLAPLLSLLFSYHFFGFKVLKHCCVLWVMFCIGMLTAIYIIQIYREMQWYFDKLDKLAEEKQSNKSSVLN